MRKNIIQMIDSKQIDGIEREKLVMTSSSATQNVTPVGKKKNSISAFHTARDRVYFQTIDMRTEDSGLHYFDAGQSSTRDLFIINNFDSQASQEQMQSLTQRGVAPSKT